MRVLAAAVLALAAAGCETAGGTTTPLDEPVSIDPGPDAAETGGWKHEPSGVVFPPRIGEYQRVDVHRYDAQGLDVSAGYNLVSGSTVLVATIYVFPAPRTVSLGSSATGQAGMRRNLAASAWKRSVQEILHAHEGSTLVADEAVSVDNGKRTFEGRRATFRYREDFGLGVPLEAESFLYGFCWVGGDWIVEYRFTHPLEMRIDPEADARARTELLQAIRWP